MLTYMPNDTHWMNELRSKFLVFDGPDGSGKTTQFQRFARQIESHGLSVCLVREPGGTSIGEQIRRVLLDTANDDMDLCCEMLLYMASRAQLAAQQIRPALAQGELVLADRFISSTLAYQGAAGGLAEADILRVGQIALGACWPDLVVIFDVDEEIASRRLVGGNKPHRYLKINEPTLFCDRMEMKGVEYQRVVRQSYLDQAKNDPDRYLIIDANADADTVFARLTEAIESKLMSM